jgi:hypothetical protein
LPGGAAFNFANCSHCIAAAGPEPEANQAARDGIMKPTPTFVATPTKGRLRFTATFSQPPAKPVPIPKNTGQLGAGKDRAASAGTPKFQPMFVVTKSVNIEY